MTAYLFDLDGTLYQGDAAIPGAPELIARLRGEGTRFRFVTNTTSKPRSAIVTRLLGYGFALEAEEVFTALRAGAALAREMGCDSIIPLVPPASLEDLAGFNLVGGTSGHPYRKTGCTAVLVGDLGPLWSFALVQEAFQALMDDACFLALSRDRYWMSATGLTIDCGAFVTALEYATGKEAVLAGKPSPAFYHAAVKSLGLPGESRDVIVVGDDLASDVGGAQKAGYQGYLVRTGKFRTDSLTSSNIRPDRIIGSVANL